MLDDHARRIVIRHATLADAGVVGALSEHAYRTDGYFDVDGGEAYAAEVLDAESRIAGAVVLVAERDDVVVGSVTLAAYGTAFAEISQPGELEVRMLAVAPEARRTGIAEQLMAAAMTHARSAGLTAIVLSTEAGRDGVHRLYGRLGYHRIPERDWQVAGFELQALGRPVD